MNKNEIVIGVEGAMGDLLCATPLFRNIKKANPDKKLIVVTFYPELLYNNPNVDLATKPTKQYNPDRVNCYKYGFENSFLGTYAESWCRSFNIPFDEDKLEFYPTQEEETGIKEYLKELDKPIIVVAPSSGYAFQNGKRLKFTANRDWHSENWEKLCKELQKNYVVIQLGGTKEEKLINVNEYVLGENVRKAITLLKYVHLWISVDSLIQHAGTAVGTKGIVLFGKSIPEIAGHQTNVNIFKNACNNQLCHRDGQIRGLWNVDLMQCPHRNCMRDISVNEVLAIVKHFGNSRYLKRKNQSYKFVPEKALIQKEKVKLVDKKGWVEIEIPTCDRHGYLGALLANLKYQTYKKWDITIVDDGADESLVQNQQIMATLQALEAEGHRWRLIRGVRQGPPIAHQKVLDETPHDLVLVIGDDCLIPPDYLERLHKVIIKDKKIAAVGGICLHLPQLKENVPYHPNYIKQVLQDDPFKFHPLQWQRHPDKKLKPVCHLYGGFIYRTEAFKAVGGFPTYLSKVGHREETDTTIRLWLAGYKLYVDPTAEFFHFRARSGGIRNWNIKELFENDDKAFWQHLEEYKKKYNYKG